MVHQIFYCLCMCVYISLTTLKLLMCGTMPLLPHTYIFKAWYSISTRATLSLLSILYLNHSYFISGTFFILHYALSSRVISKWRETFMAFYREFHSNHPVRSASVYWYYISHILHSHFLRQKIIENLENNNLIMAYVLLTANRYSIFIIIQFMVYPQPFVR